MKLNIRCMPYDVLFTVWMMSDQQREKVARWGFQCLFDMTPVGLEPACGQQRSWGPATAIPIFPINSGRTVLVLFLIPSTAEPQLQAAAGPLGPGVQIPTQDQDPMVRC
ncbi:hypothetical protein BS78_K191100 [Paspalum vaginatum]|uniref:Uncharacterized protein n=1 Tax=Paspalum vaginatum TaxID=158149 RepID=A0A9W8CFA6_9POAL|nr:hypothetical protein BS78_K191100 [Paspalum vaginatum]KAJ1255536.1 hypothetical protein BS78_K191100 [Paspalum vaginatum]KAJ1255537.1 hypothetical protein BS78_K191100 [Paspalum vaginatum]